MKKLIFLFLFTATCILNAQTRTDSIHVANYDINLSVIDFTNKTIEGYTKLDIVSKVDNLSSIQLDFISSFSIDSIVLDEQLHGNYSFSDDLLTIYLDNFASANDTLELFVYYQGVPFGNNKGGFTFTGEYAYNLGASLFAVPPSYGRVWIPCIDDFRDKSNFSFTIRTQDHKMAICNGLLKDSTHLPDNTISWRWELQDPIPVYLASVAIGEYELYQDTFHSINSSIIPITIYSPPAYMSKIPASFTNLKPILRDYETKFIPYPRERIGYVLVNFNGGALEHSTNIAYPYFAVNGTSQFEFLYAHEVSHEWFGNLITCEKPEEMWINEGFASYCQLLVQELLYSDSDPALDGYKNAVRDLHYSVLTTAHNNDNDGDYYALNNVPLDKIYGSTSYDKGALIISVLRNYLGDSLFFKGIKSVLTDYAFKSIGSEEFFNHLSQVTNIDMTGFYEAYINQPGFLHFSIDSIVKSSGTNQYEVHLRQRLHHADNFANDNRLDLTFFASDGNIYTEENVTFSGEIGTVELTIPFEPVFGVIDYYEKLADALIDENKWISKTGQITYENTGIGVNVNSIQDSVFARVEYNYVQPDGLKTPNPNIYRISDNHYWRIEYLNSSAMNAELYFQYVTRSNNGIDNELINGYSVNDLILLYRRNPGEDWIIVPSTHTGSTLTGYLKTSHFYAGEYTLAVGDQSVSLPEYDNQNVIAYPNPTKNAIHLKINDEKYTHYLLTDINGKRLFTNKIESSSVTIDLTNYATGEYIIQLYTNKKRMKSLKVIKK
jgi:aminopeptidase N